MRFRYSKISRESASPLARMHALYALDGLHALDIATLLARLSDEHPGVREHAVRLAERSTKDNKELRTKLLAVTDDSDARVRYQVAFSLGELSPSDKMPGLLTLAKRDGSDRWLRLAILTSSSDCTGELFSALLNDVTARRSSAARELIRALALQIGRRRNHAEAIAARVLHCQTVGFRIEVGHVVPRPDDTGALR